MKDLLVWSDYFKKPMPVHDYQVLSTIKYCSSIYFMTPNRMRTIYDLLMAGF